MKKLMLSICTLALVSYSYAQDLDRSIRPKPGPAPEIKLGKSQSFTLPNGLQVFVVENHKLPTIQASIQLDIQPALEGNTTGMLDMMSELLKGGTDTRTKDELNQEIDYIGARIGASHDGVYASGLKKYQDKIFDLMADITMNAKFTEEELEKIKTQMLSGLEAEENEPDAMVQKVAAVVNYGKQHLYGEIANKETIKNIQVATAEKYYNTYFRPNVAYMAIVGDVTLAEIKPMIEKYFGKWQKGTVPKTNYTTATKPTQPRVIVVPRDAAVQSVMNVTYPIDLKPGSPDVIKAKVANSILGGGSNGRLFLNLREKHGWTYGSYSSLIQDDIQGHFTAYAKARNEVTDSSVNEMIAEMNQMRNIKIGEEELQNHITNMSGAFAIGLESPSTVAQYAINIERYDMPENYYQNYLKNLSAVTAADVQNIAKKYINPTTANIIVVGSEAEIVDKLKRFDGDGEIELMDTYGNPIKATEKIAAPTDMTGDDVIKKYQAALGGEKAATGIKDMKVVMTGSMQGNPLTLTEWRKAPNKLRQEMAMNGMVMQKMVYDGTKGYQEAQGQHIDMEGDELKNIMAQADILSDFHPEKYGLTYKLLGIEQVEGKNAYKVEETNAAGEKEIQYYDEATGLLVKQVQTIESPQGSFSMETYLSDYKEVPGTNGYKIPHAIKMPIGPGMFIDLKLTSVDVNKNIADAEFQ